MIPISPLSLDCLTRDIYGSFDAAAIAQLAPVADLDCYQPRLYMTTSVLTPTAGYFSNGITITPGAIIYGVYSAFADGPTALQIRDMSLDNYLFDEPIPGLLLANDKATVLSLGAASGNIFAAPNLFPFLYPVVGTGLFTVEVWAIATSRVQIVFGVLEPTAEACL